MGTVLVASDSLKETLVVGVSIAIVFWGLRGLWKYQHRLDRRGYLVQVAAIIAGGLLIGLGFLPHGGLPLTILFCLGVFLVWAFLLFPDIVYYLLRLWDRMKEGGWRIARR